MDGADDTKPFLDSYGGQDIDRLLEMESEYRTDSLICALQGALLQKQERTPLNDYETAVLAIEALEREVNNGGFEQFFTNSSAEYAGSVADHLRRVGCPKTASMCEDALSLLRIEGTVDFDSCNRAMDYDDEDLREQLSVVNDRYYDSDEPIGDILFAWVKGNREHFRIP